MFKIFMVGLLITILRKVYCWVYEWKCQKIGEYLAKLRTKTWWFRALSSSFNRVFWPGVQCARDNHAPACNCAKYSSIFKKISLTTLTTSMSLVTDKRCCACAHAGTRSTSEVARWYTTCVAENSLFMATRSCLCRSTVADLRAEAGAARVAR